MSKQDEISEVHEHPFFNGQRHEAVWVRTWASSGTSDEMPENAPVSCAICGRVKNVTG